MAIIKMEKATVILNEQELRDIQHAINLAKAQQGTTPYCTDPMPDDDMSLEMFRKERQKRGLIYVESPYASCNFQIQLETNLPQESIGYKLVK